jgi:hypothetical protein
VLSHFAQVEVQNHMDVQILSPIKYDNLSLDLNQNVNPSVLAALREVCSQPEPHFFSGEPCEGCFSDHTQQLTHITSFSSSGFQMQSLFTV